MGKLSKVLIFAWSVLSVSVLSFWVWASFLLAGPNHFVFIGVPIIWFVCILLMARFLLAESRWFLTIYLMLSLLACGHLWYCGWKPSLIIIAIANMVLTMTLFEFVRRRKKIEK
jgi:hypothetical protein